MGAIDPYYPNIFYSVSTDTVAKIGNNRHMSLNPAQFGSSSPHEELMGRVNSSAPHLAGLANDHRPFDPNALYEGCMSGCTKYPCSTIKGIEKETQ
jgi:hypothetical protein